MGKSLIIKGADFSAVAAEGGYVFITGKGFRAGSGIVDINTNSAGNALMVTPIAKAINIYPYGLHEYNLIDVPPEAKGVRIFAVNNANIPGLTHGVNLESTAVEENTNALGWTEFDSTPAEGAVYTFPANFYTNGFKWLKCTFKKTGGLITKSDVDSNNFRIKFIY